MSTLKTIARKVLGAANYAALIEQVNNACRKFRASVRDPLVTDAVTVYKMLAPELQQQAIAIIRQYTVKLEMELLFAKPTAPTLTELVAALEALSRKALAEVRDAIVALQTP